MRTKIHDEVKVGFLDLFPVSVEEVQQCRNIRVFQHLHDLKFAILTTNRSVSATGVLLGGRQDTPVGGRPRPSQQGPLTLGKRDAHETCVRITLKRLS